VQTGSSSPSSSSDSKAKKLGFFETIQFILRKGGISAFWRGIGPALILVANPVLQYTFFEQLKNMLVLRRTERLRASGNKGAAVKLSDLDYFFLGALSKLCEETTYPSL
jgi:adenine nucleotide transporter 17